MKEFRPNVLLIHALPTSKSTAFSIGLNKLQVVAIAELKAKLMITGFQCPGSLPMLSNFFSAWDRDDNPDMIDRIRGGPDRIKTFTQYVNGCAYTLYPVTVWEPKFFLTFKKLQRAVYMATEGECLVVGLHVRGKVMLNFALDPAHRVQEGDGEFRSN